LIFTAGLHILVWLSVYAKCPQSVTEPEVVGVPLVADRS